MDRALAGTLRREVEGRWTNYGSGTDIDEEQVGKVQAGHWERLHSETGVSRGLPGFLG